MNLFNKIEKFEYISNNPNEFVSLQEYVLFDDERNGEKYIVFKFVNNLNQSLHAAKFELSQYNSNKDLLETCTVSFRNFKAKTKESFVPHGKFKVNKDFASLSIKLISAKFEKMVFENGECADIPYTFEEYKEELKSKVIAKETKKLNKIKEKKKRILKSENSKFKRKDIFGKHNVKFPKVLNAIVSIALLVFAGYGALYARQNASYFTYDYTDYTFESDSEVRISGYDNSYGRVTIPNETLGYKVISVGGEDGNTVFYNEELSEFVIDSEECSINAFSVENCKNLNLVYSYKTVRVRTDAFVNCTNLKEICLPHGTVYNNSFLGCYENISVIEINRVIGCNRLGDIFGCNNEDFKSLSFVYLKEGNIPYGFLDNLPSNVNVIIR